VRVITVSLKPGASGADEQAARGRIDAAVAEIKGGKDFAEVAKEKSDDPSKANGGELGFVAKGQSPYGKTLEDEALKLKPGAMSEVFKDRSGFHVLKGEEERAQRVQPLDEVKHQIALDLVKAQKAKELAKQKADETLAQLRAGKELKDLFAEKKSAPGQFDFSSFTTPQTADTEVFHPAGGFVPGVGQAPKLSAAAFAMTQPGALPAAPVEEGDTWYVFKLKSRERADMSKLDAVESKTLRDRLVTQKQNELYSKWIEGLRKKSRIVENPEILSYETGNRAEQYSPDDY
jgi:peptidyl-prolyl cis-trans isomerase D